MTPRKSRAKPPPSPITIRSLMTTADVRQILQVGETKLNELVKDGHIPAIRMGRCLRFHFDDVEAWINRQRGVNNEQ